MIVSFLAILIAGGAYVPMDLSYPQERLALLLEDANIQVVLTEEKASLKVPESSSSIVCLDTQRFDTSCDNPAKSATATNLAYVIYTSGSSGRPKGVSVAHRAVVRLVLNTNYVKLGPTDCIAQASNASFDAATFEIWGALLNGASLIGISQSVLLSPREFSREIQEKKINTLFLTPALFNQLASEVPAAFQHLRYLLLGGDTCDPKWVRKILQNGSPQHL